MNKQSKVATLLGLAVLLAASTASAVPDTMTFSGRLSTTSGPVTGSVNLVFRIFPAASGGTHTWTETRNGVGADNGLVYVELGQLTPLDEVVFDDATVFLEIQVGSETLSPRIAINSVPYAIRAGSAASADSLGGTIDPGDVVTSVTGGAGISAATAGNGVTVGLSTTGCANNEVWKFDGSTFNCVADADTTYTGASPVLVMGTSIGLSTTGCVAGDVWTYSGSTWSCDPAGTTYSGTSPISVMGTSIGLSTTGCVAGDVWKFNGSGWSCDPDDTGTVVEGDGVIGNEVTNVTNASLTRSGSGTAAAPYTLGLNTGNANTWTAAQTFSAGITASSFTYSTPVAGQVIASPTDCVRALGGGADPDQNTGVVNPPINALGPSIDIAGGVANTAYQWHCPVPINVPPGATVTITGATFAYVDSNATTGMNCRVQADLVYKTFGATDFGTTVASVYSGTDVSDFATTGSGTKAFPAFSAFNVPSNRHVFVLATIANNATAATGDCRYSGVLIDYTVNRP